MIRSLAGLFGMVALGVTALGVVLAVGLVTWTSVSGFRRRKPGDAFSGRPRSLFQSSHRDVNKDASP